MRAGRRCAGIPSQLTERAALDGARTSRPGPGEVACASSSSRAHISPLGWDGAWKVWSCHPCVVGAALRPVRPGSIASLGRSTASRCGQMRRRATRSEHMRPHWPRKPGQSRKKALRAIEEPAAMTPRDGVLRAAEVVTSHRAADGAGASIEPGRTGAQRSSRRARAARPRFWRPAALSLS